MLGGVLSELPKYKVVTPASGSVVDLVLAKDYLRLNDDIDDQNDYLQALIDAATDMAETITRRKLLTQQWSLYWDGFPPQRRLEFAGMTPFVSLDLFEYLRQSDGALTTMDPTVYDTDDKTLVPAVVLQSLVPMWPLTKYLAINSVHVKVTAGYGTGDNVPSAIKMAILRMVSTWYDNAAEVVQGMSVSQVPVTAQRLLMPYKVFTY